MQSFPTFQDFRSGWLESVVEGNPSTTELGRRFAQKLITQWLDVTEDSDDLVYCDGTGDGGIDIAYLEHGEDSDEESTKGDTWYLVQSKYGSAFQGKMTMLTEAEKVFDTLEGDRHHLSSFAEGLIERLLTFRSQASERDRIILVLATEKALNEGQRKTLESIRAMGHQRLGPIFDVEAVSIETIYQRQVEGASASAVHVTINTNLMPSGNDLLVGPISLLELYSFLKKYREQTGDLDRLYERNVRRFLGTRGRVNNAIKRTLEETPERFGLYNNGITIVVSNFQHNGSGTLTLYDPYVVNGCQTTRTIWDVCYRRLEAGGTGRNPRLEDWRQRAGRGVIVAKVVKVASGNEEAIQEITRYTNSQNAVREKDFLGLTKGFDAWASEMETRYGVFLEIQRGGWDSRYALQRQNPAMKQLKEHANAFDLIKVYGAGWLKEPGTAFGNNAPFLPPNGSIFKEIMSDEDGQEPFGVDDLYAAYRLQHAADGYRFGRKAPEPSRRQTRFLFYMVTLDLLRDVMLRANMNPARDMLTKVLIKLLKPTNYEALKILLDTAVEVIDEYLNPSTENSVFREEGLNNDLSTYLKSERFGKIDEAAPRLRNLLEDYKRLLGRSSGGQFSPRQVIASAIL